MGASNRFQKGRRRPSRSGRAEPIAIVGAACRFPGAGDLASLWRALRAGRDLVAEGAPDPGPDPARDPRRRLAGAGRFRGAFLADVDRFDAGLFGISRREAELMDPQQRLLLEAAWSCLEDGAVLPQDLAGSRTAVFVGLGGPDYRELMREEPAPPGILQLTGSAASVAANRISHFLDLRGPSLAIDSSNASSLVAVHQAVRTLQAGDASAALAGAVNLCLHPAGFLALGDVGLLAPDGRCRSLDATSAGFVRAEGVAMLLLKPLAAARRDRDPIRAVIAGSAASHGGRTETMSLTRPGALVELMGQALDQAAISPADLGMLELHATGTPKGDAVELEALARLFAGAGVRRPRAAIGSVKTNLGHAEAAAGLAGLLKAMLAVEHGEVPAHLHLDTLRAPARGEAPPFDVPARTRPWPKLRRGSPGRARRYAGITALGIGGAAAHVVLAEAPAPRARERRKGRPDLLVLSARSEQQLRAHARQLFESLEAGELDATLRDLCHTSRIGRTPFEHRLAIVTRSRKGLARKLHAFLAGAPCRGLHTAAAPDDGDPPTPRQLRKLVRDRRLTRIARLWVAGTGFRWKRLRPRGKGRRVAFPACPFQGERFWIPTGADGRAAGTPAPEPARHPVPARDPKPSPAPTPAAARPSAGPPAGVPAGEDPGLSGFALEHLRELVSRALRCAPGALAPDAVLADRGLDSILSIEVLHALEQDLGKLPAFLFHENRTLARLAEALLESAPAPLAELRALRARAAGPAAPALAPTAPATSAPAPPGPPEGYPLSENQKLLLLAFQMDPESTAYNVPLSLGIRGDVPPAKVAAALRLLVDRYPVLSTRISLDAAGARQVLQPGFEIPLRVAPAGGIGDDALQIRLALESLQPIPLVDHPLVQATLLTRARGGHGFSLVLHHAICDGLTLNRIFDDLEALLSAPEPAMREAGVPPPPGTATYLDFVQHQRATLAGSWAGEAEAFWRRELEGFAPPPEPPARAAGRVPTVTFTTELGLAGAAGIARSAATLKVTPFAVVLAAYSIALARASGRRDVVVALPFAGRPEARFRDAFGYFVNLIPKRVRLDGDPTLGDLVQRLARESLAALAHGDYPLYTLLERLGPSLGLRAADLTGATFYFHNWMRGKSTLLVQGGEAAARAAPDPGPTTTSMPGSFMAGEFDLTLEVYPVATWKVVCKFNPARHDRLRMEALVADVRALLERIVAAPGTPLEEALQAPPAEVGPAAVVKGAELALPGTNVLQVIEDLARRHPDRRAVLAGSRTVGYAELWREVGRIAACLQAGGIGPGRTVALSLRRDEEMPARFLGVLLSGARFVPLDPAFPEDRRRAMCEIAGVDGFLVDPALRDTLLLDGGRDLTPLLCAAPPAGAPPSPAAIPASAQAYVIFTSGSTGRPKGALISHGALVNSLYFTARALEVRPEDCFAFTTSINFDPFLTEMIGPLLVGASLEVFPEGIQRDGIALAEALEASRATFFQATPTSYRGLLAAEWKNRRRLALLTGGEPLTSDLAAQLLPLTDALWNLYGPVESTVWTSVERVRPFRSLGLGSPIANVEYFVLDEREVPVPRGREGELFIGGLSLGEGYLGLPEGARQGFQGDRHGYSRTGRLYRTGDRVVLADDGTLLFQGRADFQVKHRGRRIELEEIEAALRAHPGVDDACAVVRGDPAAGHSELVGFVVGTGDLAADRIRGHLERGLPGFMIPDRIQRLVRFPKTLSLKLDRKALGQAPWDELVATWGAPADRAAAVPAAPVPPPRAIAGIEGLVEELRAVAEKVLPGVGRGLGARANFGESGFDSIRLTQLSVELQKRLGVRVQPARMFEHRTLERLAEHMAGEYPELLARPDPEGRTPGPGPAGADPGREPAGPADDPVVISGMAGRMPGGRDLADFWRVLLAGEDQVTEIPATRWDWREHYGPTAPEASRGASKWGGFTRGVDEFDPRFFGIAPAEARLLDPQQRLFLQHAWEALEDAGLRPGSLRGTRTGVYVAVSFSDYATLVGRAGLAGSPLSLTGAAMTVIPNRLSFLLDLRGASTTVDTACSSSLVALHRAAEAMRRGEIETAIVGATNLLLESAAYVSMGKNGMLSPDGRCRTFDRRANGYVRGEGVGVVVLQRLSAARRGGHPVYAVLRGTAENHGGHASSLTAPNPEAQQDLVQQAHRRAGVDPRTITFLETHGTGTSLGDPIETNALVAAFRTLYAERGLAPPVRPHCRLGAVKSNVGHLEAAAGMAGLVKTLLAMEHGVLPGNLHCEQQNPMVDLAGSPFRLAPGSEAWTRPGDGAGGELPRRAGISSFGFGGSNAHAVVEECRADEVPAGDARPELVLVAGRSPDRLREQVRGLAAFLRARPFPPPDLARLAFTLQEGREHFEARWFTVAASVDELLAALDAFLQDGAGPAPLRFDTFLPGRGPARPLPAGLETDRRGGLDRIGRDWLRGTDFDWAALHAPASRRHLRLPPYAFARESYWIEAARPAAQPAATLPAGEDLSPLAVRFEAADPAIRDHLVHGRPVVPGVYQLLEVLRAARVRFPGRELVLRDVLWARPVRLDGPVLRLAVGLTRTGPRELAFEVRDEARAGPPFTAGLLVEDAPRALPVPAGPGPGEPLEELAPGRIYQAGAEAGIGYGPAFRVLARVRRGGDRVYAELALPGSLAAEAARPELHPCLLDGALQAAGPLLPAQAGEGTLLPFFVAEFSLAGPGAARVRATAWREDGHLSCRLDTEAGALVAAFRGIQARPLPAERGTPPARPAADPRPSLGDRLLAGAPQRIPVQARVGSRFAALRAEGRRQLVSRLAALGVLRALEEPRRADEVLERCGIRPGHLRLLGALLNILAAEGTLVRTGDRYRVRAGGVPVPPLASAPAGDPEPFGRLLTHCLAGLGDVLTGTRRATEVLFPDGDTSLVADTYGANDLKEAWNQALAGTIETYVRERRRREPGCQVRILEAGAGTGSSSRPVLERLAAHAAGLEFVFTDVSPLFVNRARSALGSRFPFARFQVLDLERDAGTQGLAPGGFDLVFATDAVHATRRLDEALGNLAGLLAGNGVLLLHESTEVSEYGTLTFGLTDGWWRFEDADLRLPDSPLVSARDWLACLETNGFGRAAWLAVPEDSPDVPGRVIVYAERAPAEPAAGRAPAAAARAPRTRDPGSGHRPPEGALAAFEADLTRLVARALELDPAEIHPETGLERFGLDSLMIIEVTKVLRERFPAVPATLLFERTTIRSLAAWFVEHLPAAVAQAAPSAPPAPVPAPGDAPVPRSPEPVAPRPPGDEPIAIVGMAGRYPMAATLEQFWENLAAGRHCITEVPGDRWDWRQGFDPAGRGETASYTKWAGFMADVDKFDPLFFRIPPRVADGLDPQERLFLECAWAAIEDAGYRPEALAGPDREAGVFVGVMNQGYTWLGITADAEGTKNSSGGAAFSIANRVSFSLDFQGPSMAIDTACSASLTAIHLACQSLRSGESRVALAGGVNLIVHPEQMRRMAAASMLAHDDRCKAFSRHADGFVDGEGVGAVVLKRLCDALRDGDRIHAVLRGSALNAGGRSNGFTVPNPKAQAAVIRKALAAAGVEPGSIDYVEAHGTGTPLGDPIEMRGIALALGDRGPGSLCRVGSVKPNIGHLESAAGIAGLTKVVLQLQHGQIAPSLFSEDPNPEIPFDRIPFRVPQALEAWAPTPGRPRRAGLSSFGAGGANAHLVVEEFVPAGRRDRHPAREHLLVLSARTPERLQVYAGLLAGRLEALAAPARAWLPRLRELVAAALEIPPGLVEPDLLLAELGPGLRGWQRLREALGREGGTQVPLEELTAARAVRDLGRWLGGDPQEGPADPGEDPATVLARVAWTLQQGRVELEHRLAFVAADLGAAARELRARAALPLPVAADAARAVPPGPAPGAGLEAALASGDHDALAAAWTRGARIDWTRLHPGAHPQPIGLPTYPFERQRCWAFDRAVPMAAGSPARPAAAVALPPAPPAHPLLEAQPETGSEDSWVFRGRLDRDERVVREHMLMGSPTLPGTGYVDLVLACAGRIDPGPVTLGSLAILAPLAVPGAGIEFRLAVTRYDRDKFDFELSSGSAPATRHGTGWFRFGPAPAPAPPDLAGLRGPGAERIPVEGMYEAIDRTGFVSYGPSYQGIRRLSARGDTALGELAFDPGLAGAFARFSLPPQVLDCAIQTAAALDRGARNLVPFAFEDVVRYQPIPLETMALVRRIKDRLYEILLLDSGGRPVARIGRCSLRPVREQPGFVFAPTWTRRDADRADPRAEAEPGPGARLLLVFNRASRDLAEALAAGYPARHVVRIHLGPADPAAPGPAVREVDAADPGALDRLLAEVRAAREGTDDPPGAGRRWQVYFLGGFEAASSLEDPAGFEAAQQEGVWSLLRLVPALHRHGFEPFGLTVLTNRVQGVFDHEPVFPAGATVAGLAKSLRHELPDSATRLIDLALEGAGRDPAATLHRAVALIRDPATAPPELPGAVALRDGLRYEQRLDEIALLPVAPGARFALGGTHLIVGGAGGIGRVLADHLLATTDSEIHLVGRRPPGAELVRAVEGAAGRLHYHQADATDPAAVEALLGAIRARRGRLDGVFMSAMVLEDRAVLKMTEESFQNALAPKVQGTRVLFQALAAQPPRLLMLFSSAVSFAGSPGQSNYVAGNCFQDSLARLARQCLPGTCVRTINWGFWGEVGAVAQERYRVRLEKFGVESITAAEGMELIERLLSQPVDQVYVLKGGGLGEEIRRHYRHQLRPAPAAVPGILARVLARIKAAS